MTRSAGPELKKSGGPQRGNPAHACEVSLSVPRERVERVILECANSELLDPKGLAKIEARQIMPATIDYRPKIAELERPIANYVRAIAASAVGLTDVVAASRRPVRSLTGQRH